MTKPHFNPVRRIVTGHNSSGKSVILSDAPSPHTMNLPGVPTFGITDLWKMNETPGNNEGYADPCSLPIVLAPPQGGNVFRLVEFPPDKDYLDSWNRETAFGGMGESGADALDKHDARHEGMHRTVSVDYAFVVSGEIWAVLDEGETLMRPGEVLIQRGTNHAWSNRSDKHCVVGFVLISALPIKL